MRRKRASWGQFPIWRSGVTASAVRRKRSAQSPRKRLTYSCGCAPKPAVQPRYASQASGSRHSAKTIGLARRVMPGSENTGNRGTLIELGKIHARVEMRHVFRVAVEHQGRALRREEGISEPGFLGLA